LILKSIYPQKLGETS